MTEPSYDVFISYRRESGSAEARLIRTELLQRGLRVFLDVTDLRRGFFDSALLHYISEAPSFVLILSPRALDHCDHDDDWLRQEIVQAINTERNIIPVILPGFTFPSSLDAAIKALPRHQGVEYSHTFFEAMVDRIVDSVVGDKSEREQTARARNDAERLTRDQAEAERVAREKSERERLLRERLESERLTKAKEEAERTSRPKLSPEKVKDERLKRASPSVRPRSRLLGLKIAATLGLSLLVSVILIRSLINKSNSQTQDSSNLPASGRTNGQPPKLIATPAGDEAQVQGLLSRWAATVDQRDFDEHISCYAPTVDRYFGAVNVSRSKIEEDQKRAFNLFTEMHLDIANIKIEATSDNSALVTLCKRWDFLRKNNTRWVGERQEHFVVSKVQGSWEITSESEDQTPGCH